MKVNNAEVQKIQEETTVRTKRGLKFKKVLTDKNARNFCSVHGYRHRGSLNLFAGVHVTVNGETISLPISVHEDKDGKPFLSISVQNGDPLNSKYRFSLPEGIEVVVTNASHRDPINDDKE